jgi:5-methylcytosine-specific restriction enzyme B
VEHPWDGEKKDIDSFLQFYWVKQDNGVCNVGQGLITSEKFKEMIDFKAKLDGQEWGFIDLNKEIIVGQKEMAQTFKLTEEWFEKFCSEKNDNHHYVVIRRFFATLYPEQLAIVVSDKITNFLIKRIKTEDAVDEDNWLKKIMALTNILGPKPPSGDEVYTRSIFFYYLYDFLYYSLLDKQTVFYGSPGTGKTYKAKRTAEDHFKAWKLLSGATVPEFNQAWQVVQFHPSFTYEDFIEGIRPGKLKNGNPQLQLVNGIFKEFCKNAAQWEFDYYGTKHFKDLLEEKNSESRSFATLKVKDISESGLLNEDRWKHLEDKNQDDPVLQYVPPFFFVIDEINRAELSRVFGELMYCLEYRGLEGKVQTQYSNLIKDTGVACFWDKEPGYFFVPHNVYIIGTMNIIDRSVESFDFALRRRFSWQRIDPSPSVLKAYLTKKSNKTELPKSFVNAVVDKMGKLNDEIKKHPLLGDDFKIGHTYFFEVLKYAEDESPNKALTRLWGNKLKSLLEEYLRGLGNQELIKDTIEKLGRDFCKVG